MLGLKLCLEGVQDVSGGGLHLQLGASQLLPVPAQSVRWWGILQDRHLARVVVKGHTILVQGCYLFPESSTDLLACKK